MNIELNRFAIAIGSDTLHEFRVKTSPRGTKYIDRDNQEQISNRPLICYAKDYEGAQNFVLFTRTFYENKADVEKQLDEEVQKITKQQFEELWSSKDSFVYLNNYLEEK